MRNDRIESRAWGRFAIERRGKSFTGLGSSFQVG